MQEKSTLGEIEEAEGEVDRLVGLSSKVLGSQQPEPSEDNSPEAESEIVLNKTENPQSEAGDAARKAILDMGKSWEELGELYQTVITYKDLIEAAPETPEAEEAKEGILRIAKLYQQEGARYTAISLYKYVMGR
jgi:hypothetical protein